MPRLGIKSGTNQVPKPVRLSDADGRSKPETGLNGTRTAHTKKPAGVYPGGP